MTPLTTIEAYQTSDGKQFLPIQKEAAELRQAILDKGHLPCDNCKCTGKVLKGDMPHWYESDCGPCKGKGYRVRKVIYE